MSRDARPSGDGKEAAASEAAVGEEEAAGRISRLILGSPYEEPAEHWFHDRTVRRPELRPGRRPAGYRVAAPGSTDPNDPGVVQEIELVNRIRPRVKKWREAGWPGVTGTTLRLLKHWTERTEAADEPRFFFCQLEAVETLIWLTEAPAARRTGLEIPSDGGAFSRICAKMATGSGKTVVMAMVIAWHFLNRAVRPQDTRFARNVLVVAPGHVVRERLAVLQPAREDEKGRSSYYDAFRIVPPGLAGRLRQGRVVVRNWHALGWETEALLARRRSVDKRGPKSDAAWLRGVLGGELAKTGGPLLVINDEAHHAWRLPPGRFRAGSVSKDEKKRATKWIEALDRLHRARGILACYDFSATPFAPSAGAGPAEALFDWIVSDFGLDDAIESGLVKTPRVVIREQAHPEAATLRPRLYRIYNDPEVKDDLNRKASPETPLPDLVRNAYLLLGHDWRETFRRWKGKGAATPPVMITVANLTETAARIHHAFEKQKVEISELCEPASLLQIDSKVLAEAEEDSGGSASAASGPPPKKGGRKEQAARLRAQVNTVGKKGEPGERIRNVISVEMLTEGWDARTVTHIMGLRAFTSQLLCEQVIGRGLRRTSYDVGPDGRFRPEYVNVLGVPFTFLPHEEGEAASGGAEPRTLVEALPERENAFGIRWPNVIRIESRLDRWLSLDWDRLDPLSLDARDAVAEAKLAPIVDGQPVLTGISGAEVRARVGEQRLQTTIFNAAQSLYDTMAEGWTGSKAVFLGRLAGLVEEFAASDRLSIDPAAPPGLDPALWKGLILRLRMNKVVLHLKKAIRRNSSTRSIPIFDSERPISSTSDMRVWETLRPCRPTRKSHIAVAVCDSSWEEQAARALDAHSGVDAWVKNDHLGFEIFYVWRGVVRKYRPDFLVRFQTGLTLILEIKGRVTEAAKEKNDALREWVKAVNQDRRFGKWASAVCTKPEDLESILESARGRPAAKPSAA